MKFTPVLQKAVRAIVLLALVTMTASASTVVFSVDVFSPYPGNLQTVPWTQTISIPQFNRLDPDPTHVQALPPAPGHVYALTDVLLTMDWTAVGNVRVTNQDPDFAHGFTNATASIPLHLSGTAATPTAGTIDVFTVASAGPISSGTSTPSSEYNPNVTPSNVTPGYGDPVPAGLDTCPGDLINGPCVVPGKNVYLGISGSGTGFGNVSNGNLGVYEGFGTSNLSFSVTSGTGTYGGNDSSGMLNFGGSAQADARVTITYFFTDQAVPEPATAAMLGTGLLGLGLALGRRRKKS